jgi:hypothetical protein
MPWAIVRGGTLLIPSGPNHHLHLILNEPMTVAGFEPEACLLLGISTIVRRCDLTCVLSVGCHPFVKEPSFIEYRWPQIASKSHLIKQVAAGVFIPREPVDLAFVKRVVSNIDVAPRASGDLKRWADAIWKTLP